MKTRLECLKKVIEVICFFVTEGFLMKKLNLFLVPWLVLNSTMIFPVMGMSNELWKFKWEQGHSVYFVNDGAKNEFRIVCGDETDGAELQVLLNGKKPQANSLVTIISDKLNITMRADQKGNIKTDCMECADNFARVLQGVKFSNKIEIYLSDGSQVEFDTLGARELLKGTICITGYYH